MKNTRPYFVQVHKNFILRCNAVDCVRYDEDAKNYLVQISGNTFTICREDAVKICDSIGIELPRVKKKGSK